MSQPLAFSLVTILFKTSSSSQTMCWYLEIFLREWVSRSALQALCVWKQIKWIMHYLGKRWERATKYINSLICAMCSFIKGALQWSRFDFSALKIWVWAQRLNAFYPRLFLIDGVWSTVVCCTVCFQEHLADFHLGNSSGIGSGNDIQPWITAPSLHSSLMITPAVRLAWSRASHPALR